MVLVVVYEGMVSYQRCVTSCDFWPEKLTCIVQLTKKLEKWPAVLQRLIKDLEKLQTGIPEEEEGSSNAVHSIYKNLVRRLINRRTEVNLVN